MTGTDEHELIDMRWWKTGAATAEWAQFLGREDAAATAGLRASTYAGRPFGDEVFVTEVGTRFGRSWTRGRPRGKKEQQKQKLLSWRVRRPSSHCSDHDGKSRSSGCPPFPQFHKPVSNALLTFLIEATLHLLPVCKREPLVLGGVADWHIRLVEVHSCVGHHDRGSLDGDCAVYGVYGCGAVKISNWRLHFSSCAKRSAVAIG